MTSKFKVGDRVAVTEKGTPRFNDCDEGDILKITEILDVNTRGQNFTRVQYTNTNTGRESHYTNDNVENDEWVILAIPKNWDDIIGDKTWWINSKWVTEL